MRKLGQHIGTLLLAGVLSSPADVGAQTTTPELDAPRPSASNEQANREDEPGRADAAPTAEPTSATTVDLYASLLEEQFEKAAEGSKKTREWAGRAGVSGGLILLGLGGWRLAEDPQENNFTRGLGVMFTTLGMVDLTTGIIAFKREPHEEERARRFKEDLKDGISEVELARYEGEFAASNHMRESERMFVRWNGLTHALAGAVVMSLSAIPDLDAKDRRSAYIIGAIFITTGSVSFGLSFRDTPDERAWKNYQKSKQEAGGLGQQVRVAPAISRHSWGLGLSGRF